jgi:hypothetical protein
LRQVLAELVSPAFNFRTVAGIAAKTHLDRRFVADVLDELARVDRRKPFSVCRVGKDGGDDLFTLASRKPKGFWSLPVISAFGNWLEPPATDLNSAGKQIGN